MIGANFRCTANADGTYTLHDVPVFCECTRGDHVYDREWLEEASRNMLAAEADGHYPPLHVRHHGDADGGKPTQAGAFRTLGVRPMRFKGETIYAIYADMFITNPDVFREIEAKRLLYRSVELLYDDHKIFGCALLDSDAPYLDLPMTTIDAVQGCTNEPTDTLVTSAPAQAVFAFSHRGTVTTAYMRGPDMPTITGKAFDHKASTGTVTLSDGTVHTFNSQPAWLAGVTKFEAEDAKPAPGADDGDKEEMAEDAGIDAAAICKAIEDKTITLGDFEAIRDAMATAEAGAEASDGDSVQDTAPPASEGPGDLMEGKEDDEVDPEKMALAGRVSALETQSKMAAKRAELDAAKAEAHASLSAYVYETSDVDKAFDDHGIAAGKHFAAAIAKVGNKASTGNFAASMAGFAQTLPDEVVKFQNTSPEAFAAAKTASATYDKLRATSDLPVSRESFIKTALKRAGVQE